MKAKYDENGSCVRVRRTPCRPPVNEQDVDVESHVHNSLFFSTQINARIQLF